MIRRLLFDMWDRSKASKVVDVILFGSLGLAGACLHHLGLDYDLYMWLINNVYAEQLEYIANGDGVLHWWYCKFILLSEGVGL